MADIKVVKNVNPITIRIGQRTVKKVVASQKAATTTLNTCLLYTSDAADEE